MSAAERMGQELRFDWEADATLSNYHNAGAGIGFGAIIVPASSPLIGKTITFVAHSPTTPPRYADTDLPFSTTKTLVEGLNRLSTTDLEEVGFVVGLKLKLNSAVNAAAHCYLLWKS